MNVPKLAVLIVDDVEKNLVVLEALLEPIPDIAVLRAASGREALELLLKHDVALALVDVQMPEMSGFDLAELMRGTERTRSVPIVFVTAGPHDTGRVFRGYELGAVDFLFKPIDPVMLRHKVTTFLDLERRRVELAEVLRLNEMFVAATSHDLRAPLATVVTVLKLLDREALEPSARGLLGRAQNSASRMLGMLEQLNDLARARLGGGFALAPTETDLRRIVQSLVDQLHVAHPDRKLVLECEAPDVVGVWDAHRLERVFSNLLGNAVRHGAPTEPIVVRIAPDAERVSVAVHNGGFIPEQALTHLFDPFWRGATTNVRDSLGLGLYIVSQIVAAHDGTVTVDSTRETGTTFKVSLPRRVKATSTQNTLPPS